MSSKNGKQRTPTRSVRVPVGAWEKWKEAAEVAGIDRNKFIVTVVNHAAHQILTEAKHAVSTSNDGDDAFS